MTRLELIDLVSGRVRVYMRGGRVVEFDSLHRAILELRKQ
jgi:hypothetical protein